MAKKSTKSRVVKTQEQREHDVVHAYARVKELEAELKLLKDPARTEAINLYDEFGLTTLMGVEGVVTISSVNGSRRLDLDLVRQLLSAEQIEACTVQGEPTVKVQFNARRA